MQSPDAPAPSSWLVAAALAGVLVGGGDALLALVRTSEPVPAGVILQVVLAAVGLCAGPAIACGLAAWAVSASAQRELGGHRLRAWVAAQLADPAADLRLGASLAAGLVCLGGCAALVYVYVRGVALQMARARNAALSTALVAAAAVPLSAACLFFPALAVVGRLVRVLPRPRTVWATGLVLLAAGGTVVLALRSVDWRALALAPYVALAAFVALVLGGRLALGRALARAPRLRQGLLGLGLTGLLVPLLLTLFRFGTEARTLIAQHTVAARPLLRAAWRLLDRDGDGHAAHLGGGDCDDSNPAIHPGADDLPGDGVDQDCEDGDAPPPPPPLAAAPSPPPALRWEGNWLFITIDTLRLDRVTAALTPHLHALGQRGVRFTAAYAQAPNTPRSFPSFLASRLPSQVHFVRPSSNFSPVTGEDPTLFTELSRAGYRAIGIFSHFYMDKKFGLASGFEEWSNDGATNLHDSNHDIAAPRITARVIARLRQLGAQAQEAARRGERLRPFALWTHLFDPHSTYMDHPEFPAGKGFRHLAARYDAEVAFTDLHVGRILAALQETDLAEHTAVVVFSDHGESLGEHRLGGEPLYFHGESLYEEVLRVPLVFYLPGVAPREVPDRVMLLDLAPTVLALAGIPAPPSFRGRSLVPALAGQPLPPGPAYAEMLPHAGWQKNERALVVGNWKLYARFTDNLMELYDLAADPTEQHNLAHRRPDRLRDMKRELSAFMRAAAAHR
ncbi:MAG: sulfatase-like hydrolase/transferase [Myxococcales bacterium]|nr:sulfatase-like hydrolase/transferase [Myxococcota bacterium]MDW8281197.1 sulfatase-like hydrolase/transferase [Myxococcales bacterium]